MIPQHVQNRRRQLCVQVDALRRILSDISQLRVTPPGLGPAEAEHQITLFLADAIEELGRLDRVVDCVQEFHAT